jgi:hypothetical protein
MQNAPSAMTYPAIVVEQCEPLWTEFFEPKLGKRATNQFRHAMRRRTNEFADRFLGPQLYRPDIGPGIYVPVDVVKYSEGRNHFLAEAIATEPESFGLDCDPSTGLSFFANSLTIGSQVPDPLRDDKLVWESPSSRVVMAPIQIFTFEFDQDVEFLREQLSWLRTSKNVLDCAMGDLYRHCATFADFAGITVNYSGNKGLHVHIAFKTDLAIAQFPGLSEPGAAIRAGLIEHWQRLHQDVLRVLKVPAGVTADDCVRLPEQFRRVPNGLRLLEKPSVLGVPAGEIVPQVTLWEKWPERAARDASTLFFTPAPFVDRAAASSSSIRTANRMPSHVFKAHLTDDEFKYCEERMATFFGDWPKFVRLEHASDGWRALFQNDPADQTPSSVMREGYNTIMLNGRGAAGLRPRKLPLPLGAMMKLWVNRHRTEQAAEPWQVVEIPLHVTARADEPCRHQVAIAGATTKDEASKHLRAALLATVFKHEVALVSGPEGIRKTSSLFKEHRRIHNRAANGDHLPSMYAFNDYETARTKCDDFNRIWGGRLFHAVVLPSFSEAYCEARRTLSLSEITVAMSASMGAPNVLAAIRLLQPEVLGYFRDAHAAMWHEIGDKLPVFFSVHQVAQAWNEHTPTRAMWDRHFWDVERPFEDKLHMRVCRRRMTLGLLVHDEVEATDLVVMHRAETVDWVHRLIETSPKVWRGNRGNLAAQWECYERFRAANLGPQTVGAPQDIDFQTVREIARIPATAWEAVETAWSGEYGDEEEDRFDLYASRVGRPWRVSPRTWWEGVARRVLILTTEAVPVAITRRLGAPWFVAEYEASSLDRDNVSVLAQHMRSAKLPLTVKAFQSEHPGVPVISNKVSMLKGTTTHARARGSNAYIGQDVAQTMTFLSPDEYERLEALNGWCGRNDLVGLRHIDEFNQSAGRNLGFRRQGDPQHWLLIPPRLLTRLLARDALGRARYDLRIQLDRRQRWYVRGRAA